MPLTFHERPGAARILTDPLSYETEYVASGEFDRATVYANALALIPLAVVVSGNVLHRQNVELTEAGFKLYIARANYGRTNPAVGSVRFSFTTTGGTFHIQASRQTVGIYSTTTSPENFGQLINVRRNQDQWDVQGADIVIPALKMTYVVRQPAGFVDENFARLMASITGTVNAAAWRGFQPGEVLFLGAEGSQGTDAETEVTYHFAAEKNLSGLVIGAISGIQKDGHDLLWLTWEDEVTPEGLPALKPRTVYVERVYERVNFAALFGF
jgi:hypothetical protein